MRIKVLGPVDVVDDAGQGRIVSGRTQRALLAALASSPGQPVSTSALLSLLWGDEQPVRPQAALQSQVSRLRRALAALVSAGDDPVRTHPAGYLLRVGSESLDSLAFEDLVRQAADPARIIVERVRILERALRLWQGDAFADFADLDVIGLEAARLEELRRRAVEDLGVALLTTGRPDDAVILLEPFVTANPFRERARDTITRALYESGRHAEALTQLRGYREPLADELGLEPSIGIRDLEVAILRHELAEPSPPVETPPLTGLAAPRSKVPAGPRRAPAGYPRVAQRLATADRFFAGRKAEFSSPRPRPPRWTEPR